MPKTDIHVLHVDDDPNLTDLTTTYLEREDDRFSTDTATSTSEGLERLSNGAIDCIISDYDMPGQDGIEFLRTVRERYPDLPFILYTGKGSEAVASDAVSAGVTDYLQKDSGSEHYELLANRIKNAVQARENAQELARQEELMRLTEFAGGTGGWELDCATNEVQLTAGAQRLTGLDREYVPYEQWLELYHPDDRPDVRTTVEHVIETRKETNGSWRLTPEDEIQRQVSVTMVPVVTDGEMTAIRGSINDLTQYRQRKQELEQTRQRMDFALDETNSIIFEIDPETDEETQYGPLEELYGVAPETVSTTEAFLSEAIHPDDRPRVERKLQEAIENALTTVTYEYRTHPENGDVRWLRVQAAGRTDEHGDVTSVIGLATEISAHKRREQRLKQYKALLESIDDAVFVVDQDETIVYANRQSLKNVGLNPENVAGEPIRPFVEQYADNPAAVDRFERALHTALDDKDRQPAPVELTLSVDGTQRVFEYSFSQIPVRNPTAGDASAGPVVAVTARNITARVRQTEQLQRTQELLEEMERIAEIGAWEYDPGADEVIRTVGTSRIYGVDSETDLSVDEAFDFYHPDDRERLRDQLQACIDTGEPYKLDLRLIRADGEQRWVTAQGEQIQTSDGECVVRGYLQDVTGQKQRLNRLEQVETLFENAQDLLFIINHSDGEFVVEQVNQAFEAATGLSNESLSGKTPREIFGEERGAQTERKYTQCVDTGEPLIYEETIREEKLPDSEALTDDGLTYWETRIAPVEVEGSVEYIVGATRNISDRKQRERELENKNRQLDQFASVVSHDLRNPLNVATASLEFAQEECDSEYLDSVNGALDRMDMLIEDLLVLARGGETVDDLKAVDLTTIAEGCWATVETADATPVIDVNKTVYADKSRLKQSFENLIRNAVEHGGNDVTVTVGDLEGGFYIEDDGSGIPEGERDDVFNAGYSTNHALG